LKIDIEKARLRKLNITANDERIKAATRRMLPRLDKWFRSLAEFFVSDAKRQLKSGKIKLKKAMTAKEFEEELVRILLMFGLRDTGSAGADMIARVDTDEAKGAKWVVTPVLLQEIVRQKEVKVKNVMRQTKKAVHKLLVDASKESPQPSVAEVARRIRESTSFSRGRSVLVARTEAAQSENTGLVEGMAIAGVDMVEWLAHTDGKSKERHHEYLNGKRIKMSDLKGSDKSKWFQTHLGSQLRYPGDPNGKIVDLANCRCTVLPVIVRGTRRIGPGKGSKAKTTAPKRGQRS
jgi:hypothetical protein